MANANIFLITLANTFNDWRIADNNLANSVNNLRNSNYVKDNGSFIVANGSLQTTSTVGTGLSIGANALISGLLTTNTLIVTGQGTFDLNVNMSNANSTTTIAGNLVVGSNTVLQGNLTVDGSQTIQGNTILTSNSIILRYSLASSGNGQLIIEQGGTNGNASLIYLQPSNVWQVTSNNVNGYQTVLTTQNIADSVSNSNSGAFVASANSVEWAYNTAINAYTQANNTNTQVNVSYAQANAGYAQANAAYTRANIANNSATVALFDVNLAYGQANNAYAVANTVVNYLPLAGGVETGTVQFSNSAVVLRSNTLAGWLCGNVQPNFLPGNVNPLGETGATTGVIYSIGAQYVPLSNNLGQLYGIGYTTSNANSNTLLFGATAGNWGMYVAAAGQTKIWLDALTGGGVFSGPVISTQYLQGGLDVLGVAEDAYSVANLAFILAEDAYAEANVALVDAENAYAQANAAYAKANTAETQALTATTIGEDAYAKANTYSSPTQSLSTDGYVFLPGGAILQWGIASSVQGDNTIDFPIAFPTACFNVVITPDGAEQEYFIVSLSASSMVVDMGGGDFYWQAIGH